MELPKLKENLILNFPITLNGVETKEISIRRPTVGDQLLADKLGGSDAEKEIAFMANLAGCAPDDLHKLDLKDYQKLQEIFRSFLS